MEWNHRAPRLGNFHAARLFFAAPSGGETQGRAAASAGASSRRRVECRFQGAIRSAYVWAASCGRLSGNRGASSAPQRLFFQGVCLDERWRIGIASRGVGLLFPGQSTACVARLPRLAEAFRLLEGATLLVVPAAVPHSARAAFLTQAKSLHGHPALRALPADSFERQPHPSSAAPGSRRIWVRRRRAPLRTERRIGSGDGQGSQGDRSSHGPSPECSPAEAIRKALLVHEKG